MVAPNRPLLPPNELVVVELIDYYPHLLGNMLYLWIFGDNIEDRLGKVLYIVFYLVCGFAAGYAQVLISPNSQIPLVGASGALAFLRRKPAYAILPHRARAGPARKNPRP